MPATRPSATDAGSPRLRPLRETDDDGRPRHGDRLGRLTPDRRGPIPRSPPPHWWPEPPTTWHCPKCRDGAERIRLGSIDLAARRIAGHRGSAVVLADGDPGFFGVVRTLRAPEHGLEVEVVPAVSAVAAAFARAGMAWDDAQVVVAHTRTLRRAVNVCRAHTQGRRPHLSRRRTRRTRPAARRRPPHLRHLRGTGHGTRTGQRPHLRQGRRPRLARPEHRHRHRRDRHRGLAPRPAGSPAVTPATPRANAAGRCPPRSTASRPTRVSRPGCARPSSPGSAPGRATWSGTSARAAGRSPPRRRASAPP